MGQLDVVSVLPDKPGWQDERRQDGGGGGGGNSGSHGGSEHKKAKRRGGCVGDAQRVRDEAEQSFFEKRSWGGRRCSGARGKRAVQMLLSVGQRCDAFATFLGAITGARG